MASISDVNSQLDPAGTSNTSNGTTPNTAAVKDQAAGLAEAAKNSEVCIRAIPTMRTALTSLQYFIHDLAVERRD